MQTRQLGKTDLNLTTVGLGTWAIGGPWQYGWGPTDDDQAIAAILKAMELGVNWIDTAPVYGLGHSEELVGKALKQTSQKPIVATKCGLLWNEKEEKVNNLKTIYEECHQSLKRLGIETIDLYQIHWPVPQEDLLQAAQTIEKLIEQGKVRYFGVSNFNIDQIKLVEQILPVASVQPPFSMLHREVEEEGIIEYCRQNSIGVLAYSPMQRGLLTGKFSEEHLANLPSGDHRKTNPDFQTPSFQATLELVKKLKPIAQKNDKSLAQLAISWVTSKPGVTAAIVGARNPRQIAETAPASDWNLSKEDIDQIEILLTQRQERVRNYGK